MFPTGRCPTAYCGPVWFSAMAGALQSGSALVPRVALGPVTMLGELRGALQSVGRAHDVWTSNFPSLYKDADHCLSAFGPALQKHVALEFAALQTALEHAQDSERLKSLSEEEKKQATIDDAAEVFAASDQLWGRVIERAAFLAAWDDLVEAFRDVSAPAIAGDARALVFRELGEVGGHDWQTFGGTLDFLAQVLRGQSDASLLMTAPDGDQQRTTDTPAEQVLPVEQRRLDGCRRRLADRPGNADVVLWLLIDQADLPEPVHQRHLQLIPTRAASEVLPRPGDDIDVSTYPEFAGEAGVPKGMFDAAVAAPAAVLARLWIPDTAIEKADAHGRSVLDGLLAAAGDGWNWKLQRSSAMWTSTMGWRPSRLMLDSSASGGRHYAHSTTGDKLASFGDDVVGPLLMGSERAEGVLPDVEWVVQAQASATPAQRVALSVRVLEQAAKRAGVSSWTVAATDLLRGAWVEHETTRWLRYANGNVDFGIAKTRDWRRAVAAEQHRSELEGKGPSYVIEQMDLAAAAVPVASDVTDWLWRGGSREPALSLVSRADRLRRLPEHLGNLTLALAPGLVETRNIEGAVALLSSSVTAREWLEAKSEAFDVLLARTERCRNRILHGHPEAPGVDESVDAFVVDLIRLVAQDRIDSGRTGKPPLDGLRVKHKRHNQRLKSLRRNNAAKAGEVLFGGLK